MLLTPLLGSVWMSVIVLGALAAIVAGVVLSRRKSGSGGEIYTGDETIVQRPDRPEPKPVENRHTEYSTPIPKQTPHELPKPTTATEMIQWYGSILCIQGALRGTKLPIDEAGFYIGRDREMATLVIEDSRISRRHVWIGVRDGKVMAVEQDSTNGTFLNSIDSPRITKAELKSGDKLILGENVAVFEFKE